MTKQIARELRNYLIFAGGTALSTVILGNVFGWLHKLATSGHPRWALLLIGISVVSTLICVSAVVVGGRSER